MKLLLASIGLSALVLWALGCGGGGGGGTPNTPTGPSSPTPSPASTTVNIVSSSSSSAFSPNPVQVPSGGTIQWRNGTNDSHVLVMSDGTSIGTVGPGATITTTLIGGGGNFRCTNHPTMVGSINGAAVPPPPPPGGDYDY
jgi:plastocyanin